MRARTATQPSRIWLNRSAMAAPRSAMLWVIDAVAGKAEISVSMVSRSATRSWSRPFVSTTIVVPRPTAWSSESNTPSTWPASQLRPIRMPTTRTRQSTRPTIPKRRTPDRPRLVPDSIDHRAVPHMLAPFTTSRVPRCASGRSAWTRQAASCRGQMPRRAAVAAAAAAGREPGTRRPPRHVSPPARRASSERTARPRPPTRRHTAAGRS